jgi:hypothetical protein
MHLARLNHFVLQLALEQMKKWLGLKRNNWLYPQLPPRQLITSWEVSHLHTPYISSFECFANYFAGRLLLFLNVEIGANSINRNSCGRSSFFSSGDRMLKLGNGDTQNPYSNNAKQNEDRNVMTSRRLHAMFDTRAALEQRHVQGRRSFRHFRSFNKLLIINRLLVLSILFLSTILVFSLLFLCTVLLLLLLVSCWLLLLLVSGTSSVAVPWKNITNHDPYIAWPIFMAAFLRFWMASLSFWTSLVVSY